MRMITRDISLEDCIFDLIDNSIDAAWAQEGGMPAELTQSTRLRKYKIEIALSETGFSIGDNCGGMPLKEAEDYAFTFGRKEAVEFEDYSIGVYGIGMKRAVFKLGKSIAIRSTYKKGRTLQSFSVPIDVQEWLTRTDEKDWDFKIYSADALPEPGVRIAYSDLNEDTKASFRDPGFEKNLRRMLSRDYTLHLHHGLQLTLNKKAVVGWPIELRESDQFEPIRFSYEDGAGVHVEILGRRLISSQPQAH